MNLISGSSHICCVPSLVIDYARSLQYNRTMAENEKAILVVKNTYSVHTGAQLCSKGSTGCSTTGTSARKAEGPQSWATQQGQLQPSATCQGRAASRHLAQTSPKSGSGLRMSLLAEMRREGFPVKSQERPNRNPSSICLTSHWTVQLNGNSRLHLKHWTAQRQSPCWRFSAEQNQAGGKYLI